MNQNMENAQRPSLSPPTFDSQDFDELERTIRELGTEPALLLMEHKFRSLELYPQLFEVLKMQCRDRIGLELTSDTSRESLDEPTQRRLEDGLLAACKEVGLLLWQQGELNTGWMYLQALGNHSEIVAALERFPVDDDHVDSLIEIAISQGAAPDLGYRWLIQKYGTCNAITTFDMQATRFDLTTQRQWATTLLNHLYRELKRNILYSLQQNPNDNPFAAPRLSAEELAQLTLSQILEANPQISARHGHLIDATHLASVVRIARLVREPSELQMALELTNYGLELDSDFQYPGVPPFEETYIDHEVYYRTQLGFMVDAGLQHFRNKCDSTSTERFGSIAYETLADLLIRMGRRSEAIQLLADHVWGQLPPSGVIGNVFLIPQTEDERKQLRDYFRDRGDLLSFGMSLL